MAGFADPTLEMEGLKKGGDSLRVQRSFGFSVLSSIEKFDSLREEHRIPNYAIAELLDLIPPFTFVLESKYFPCTTTVVFPTHIMGRDHLSVAPTGHKHVRSFPV